ncbi:MAG: hypothetical protein KC493_02715 [Bacteriovoracaceae bacterium]|nr:hypothetical protein [Bacteriovoracaceae bacterium]
MKILISFLFMICFSAIGAEPLELQKTKIKPKTEAKICQTKNNAPVSIISERVGANVKITIKVLDNMENSSIKFYPNDDLVFLESPADISRNLVKGESIVVNIKVQPTLYRSYIVAQISGLQYNFPRVKTLTIPIDGVSSDGKLSKGKYLRKKNAKLRKKTWRDGKTRNGRKLQFVN